MKINVTCIYWFLLLISFVSSCLLFILVASESVKPPSSQGITSDSESPERDVHSEINIFSGGEIGASTPENIEGEDGVDGADIRSSFNDVSAVEDNSDAHKEFLISHNSGVSSGIVDTGQAVVFTLVDTASAELEQRADSIPTTPATHITQPLNDINKKNSSSAQVNFAPTVLVSTPASDSTSDGEQDITGIVSSTNEEKENTTSVEEVQDSGKNSASQEYVVRAEPKVFTNKDGALQNKTAEDIIIEVPTTENVLFSKETQTISDEEKEPTKDEHEDIPSFSEWTQKQLEEAEKKKEKVNASAQSQPAKQSSNLKLRSKNYASPDCGAKIVAANPEAISAGSVLSPSRDEYKLNTCTSRIWFIVELCEAIQAKKIDLANFELFSSSPKDFTVSVSDRFPSREWSSVGQFQAKDERDVQSFNLHPHLFGKFIKVEMISHWGSEHFCPISLFRVYGTSEFEVLETEDRINENASDDDNDDDEETLDSYKGELSNNLFGSARDAVMSIVKKAAEVLVKSGDKDSNRTFGQEQNSAKYSPLINTCSTPCHLVVCDNCSDVLFGNVYELLSCQRAYLQQLVHIPIMKNTLYNTDICVKYGFNFYTKSVDNFSDTRCDYTSTFFAPKYLAGLCNVVAVIENKVVLNISNNNQYSNASSNLNTTLNNEKMLNIEGTKVLPDKQDEDITCANTIKSDEETKSIIVEDSIIEPPVNIQIKPTKTLQEENQIDSSFSDRNEESSIVSSKKDITLDPSESTSSHSSSNSEKTSTISVIKETVKNSTDTNTDPQDSLEIITTSTTLQDNMIAEGTENYEIAHDQLDKLLSELNLDPDSSQGSTVSTTVSPPNVPQQAQKESVFLRLSNRIKALERNMSLSGQYLEELSRRYKKQVEEMQRAFEKKLAVVSEENKKREEREHKLQEQLEKLTNSVENLLTEKDSMWKTASLLGQFLLMEVFVTCVLLYFCWKTPEGSSGFTGQKKQKGVIQVKRRKSIDTIGHESPVVHRKRRPSEEALKISGTYEDLLIIDEPGMSKAEKRRRRKKNALLRSQSVINYKNPALIVPSNNEEPTRRASSSDMVKRNLIVPANHTNGDITPGSKIQEIPFVLEESEHTAMEKLTYIAPEKTISADYASIKTSLNKIAKNGSIKSSILKNHSPLFMKTALSSRVKRNSISSKRLSLFKTDSHTQNSSHRKSPEPSLQSNSFSVSDSLDDQSSLNSDTSKKDKRFGGFKKIFKRVFE